MRRHFLQWNLAEWWLAAVFFLEPVFLIATKTDLADNSSRSSSILRLTGGSISARTRRIIHVTQAVVNGRVVCCRSPGDAGAFFRILAGGRAAPGAHAPAAKCPGEHRRSRC